MDTESKRAYNRAYYEKNKEKEQARKLEHYHANKEVQRARNREYWKTYQRPKPPPEKRAEENRKRRERYANDPAYRERLKQQAKGWAKMSPERKRATRLKSDYGISIEEYERLLEVQNGGCAICGTTLTGVREKEKRERKLSVDHDHSTGMVRGILCHHCNFGIGHFKDDPELLRRAMDYLTRSSSGVL